ncbi:MAG: dicarboxylate/amino acid:cation symporter [Phycisphaerales bacterium]|jgi:Na+/H+-dicarboxylate symporter|nr:dicarboxylate/amino acid:cation symporter [Phycisphaerales bacterium]
MRRVALHWRILIGFGLGIAAGLIASSLGGSVEGLGFFAWLARLNEFVGDVFLRSLQFIAAPIVLFSLIVGTASLNDLRKMSRIGGKTVAIYLCTTALAITIGLVLANAIRPGSRLSEEVRDRIAGDVSLQQRAAETAAKAESTPDAWSTLLNLVPKNPFEALATGQMLQIVVLALLVGVGLTLIPREKAAPVIAVCDAMTEAIIKIVHLIMLVAPFAVFCLIAKAVATLGFETLKVLAFYCGTVVLGLALVLFVVYPAILYLFARVGPKRYFTAIAPAQLLAFSSSSSSATLPVTMDCVKNRMGASDDVTSFVVPLGATVNMDGTALYQGVAAIFIAELYGDPHSLEQQLTIVLTATLASIGTAGVPGVGMIMLVIVLNSIGMPAEHIAGGLAIIFGVDRLLDMCRTVVNVSGDAMVATVVAASEKELLSADEVARRMSERVSQPIDESPPAR